MTHATMAEAIYLRLLAQSGEPRPAHPGVVAWVDWLIADPSHALTLRDYLHEYGTSGAADAATLIERGYEMRPEEIGYLAENAHPAITERYDWTGAQPDVTPIQIEREQALAQYRARLDAATVALGNSLALLRRQPSGNDLPETVTFIVAGYHRAVTEAMGTWATEDRLLALDEYDARHGSRGAT